MLTRLALLVLLFLLAMKLVDGWRKRVEAGKAAPRVEAARKCPACGAYVLGDRPCTCGRPDGPTT